MDNTNQEENVSTVVEVLNDFFGEEYVYCCTTSGQYIVYIHFPEITIRNENNLSRKLKDIYVKFLLNTQGKLLGDFTLTRSTYTNCEYNSNYCHSHTLRRYTKSDFIAFSRCCLGNGPIKSLICQLQTENHKATWMLFCVELLRYLETESLSGGPYISMKNIKYSERALNWHTYTNKNYLKLINFNDFLNSFYSKKLLNFGYIVNHFQTISLFQFTLLLSEHFIDFVNQNKLNVKGLLSNNVIVRCVANEATSTFLTPSVDIQEINTSNTKVLRFKDKDIYLKVILEEESPTYHILNPLLVEEIYNKTLNFINSSYEFK